MNSLLNRLKQLVFVLFAVVLCAGCAQLPQLSQNPWEVISLETESTFSDIGFTDNLDRGWIVGSNATLFKTDDGGKTWEPRSLELGEENLRFNAIDFAGKEGWIVGEPSLLLHTKDGGDSWERIALSKKLPGNPRAVIALGSKSAEMTTDVGAIYRTEDGGKTWQGTVEEALGAMRNITRSADGKYVAVSSLGNFYSTWNPGEKAWIPHNRSSSRHVQNMGFTPQGQLWMLARGGQIQFTGADALEDWQDPIYPEKSRGWGLLDLAYRTPEEVWVAGGSGTLLCSVDGGQTWLKDRELDNVPSNFNKIKFISGDRGFVLGQRGTLLRYIGTQQSA